MKFVFAFLLSLCIFPIFAQGTISGGNNRAFSQERFVSRRFVIAQDTFTDVVGDYTFSFPNYFPSPYICTIEAVSDTLAAAGAFAGNAYVECSLHETNDNWFRVDTISLEAGKTVSQCKISGLRTRIVFDISDGSGILNILGYMQRVTSFPSIVTDDFEGV